jgi:protein phosphatase
MGGHAGGDVASKLAVDVIGGAFTSGELDGSAYPNVPPRGAELAMAIQAANKAIYDHARSHREYAGMGTTIVSARFSPNKQRVYIGHVGDSRCYRVRNGVLTQVTTDHTMASEGVIGPLGAHLLRALGVTPAVKIDLIIMRPQPEDAYLLCTDGLSKMVPDEEIRGVVVGERDPDVAVRRLIALANDRGGRDNITVILVRVQAPKDLASDLANTCAS